MVFSRELSCYGVLSISALRLYCCPEHSTCYQSCSLRHKNVFSAISLGGCRYLREMFTKAHFGLGRMISLSSSIGSGGEQDPAGQPNPPMPCLCPNTWPYTWSAHFYQPSWDAAVSAPPSHSWKLEISAKAIFGNDLRI